MAWPTSNASTDNLDAGSDNPGLARADIKTNIDNTNAIIDEFGNVNISSPSAGEALIWDSVNSYWRNGNAVGTSSAYIRASLQSTATFATTGGSANSGNLNVAIDNDSFSLINSATGADINLVAGNYLIIVDGLFTVMDGGAQPSIGSIELYNDTTSAVVSSINFLELTGGFLNGQYLQAVVQDAIAFTLSGTTDLNIRFTADAGTGSGVTNTIISNMQLTLFRR